MSSPSTEVLRWIGKFKGATATFTEGCCFWFAMLLRERYGADIWYAATTGHFIGKIGDYFYDVRGVFTPDADENLFSWDELQKDDEVWASHLKRDCIDML